MKMINELYKIHTDFFTKMENFIGDSIHYFQSNNVEDDKLEIYIHNYVLRMYQEYRYSMHNQPPWNEKQINHFMGIEVKDNYDKSIVVTMKDIHYTRLESKVLRLHEHSEERILCAANYYNDFKKREHQASNLTEGFITCGLRHHNCISAFAQIYGFPYTPEVRVINNTEVQGFLTSKNRFVERMEALEIARKAGQLITGEGNSKLGLFSEDLY